MRRTATPNPNPIGRVAHGRDPDATVGHRMRSSPLGRGGTCQDRGRYPVDNTQETSMNVIPDGLEAGGDDYLISKRQAWFAFAMTFGLMLFDYIDRQVIVSLFPHIKAEWGLSDKELGSLVSIISIVVGVGGIPVALLADRVSRVKSIVVMSTVWSLATISCMFTASFGQLFAARAVVGAGETGYGSVGAALISTLFPKRLRSTVLGAFFAAASLGAVLGVVLGGVIAAHWGWKAAFGVVGVPGLVLALLYLFVRDYKTVALTPKVSQVSMVSQASRQSLGGTLKHIFGTLARTRTLLWACVAGAMQLVTMSAVTAAACLSRCPRGERPLVELYLEPGVFSEGCTEKLPLRADCIHRLEFGEVSGHRVLIKRGPGNRGPTECGTPHEATSGMSSRSEEHTSELQAPLNRVCRLLLEKKKIFIYVNYNFLIIFSSINLV